MTPRRLPKAPARSRQLCAAVAVAITAFAGYTTAAGTAAAEPIPAPADDPFYAAPANLAALGNGAIVQSREISLFGLNLNLPVKAWQVQYKSSDGNNNPTTGMATVIVPSAPWTGPGARPLVSYQLAEDSLGTRCTTSYSLRAGLGAGGLGGLGIGINNTNSEASTAAELLLRNWGVVLSDYQGPQSRFLDGGQTAHGVLDGIRAALAFGPAGLSAQSPLGAMGYSGGAFATTWALGRQPGYAPELHFDGTAMGGVPANLSHVLQITSGTYSAGLGLLALTALDRNSPQTDIPALLNDRGRAVLAENTESCGTEFVAKYAFANYDDYTAEPNIGANPRIIALSEQNRLEPQIPAGPTYVWHSTGDDVLPIADTDTLVHNWCAAGASVTYARTSVPTHIGACLAGIPAAIDYLDQRFSGTPAPNGCA